MTGLTEAEIRRVMECPAVIDGLREATKQALIQMRKETIEECAKVCEGEIDQRPSDDWERGVNRGAYECAQAIRNLNKEK